METAEAPFAKGLLRPLEEVKLFKDHIVSDPRLLDKSRALYRRARERDPSLPPLLPTAGKVEVKDAIRVVLPTVAGLAVVVAAPVGGWRFRLVCADLLPADVKVAAAPAVDPPTAALDAQMKQMGDTMLEPAH